jgi:hypothetical protein
MPQKMLEYLLYYVLIFKGILMLRHCNEAYWLESHGFFCCRHVIRLIVAAVPADGGGRILSH